VLQSLRLDENLMALLLGEAHHLVLDGGAVARTGGVDLSGVHRRAVEVRADQVVGKAAGVGEPAEDLRLLEPVGEDGERARTLVARSFLQLREVDGGAVDARGRTGLQAAEVQAESPERIGERLRGRLAETAAGGLLLAGVHQRPEEGAGGDDDRLRLESRSVAEHRPSNRASLDDQRLDRALDEVEVRLRRENVLHGRGVQIAVTLRARALHGRTLGAVEDLELNPRAIRGLSHQPAEGVDLLDQVSLGQTTDRRVARHTTDGIAEHRDHGDAGTAAGADARRLSSGVSAADDQDVPRAHMFHVEHHAWSASSHRVSFADHA
jgi:hypothetical protein